jgi:hypothetical protein
VDEANAPPAAMKSPAPTSAPDRRISMMFSAPTFNARGDDNHSPADERDARAHEDEGENFAYRAHAPIISLR